MLTRDEREDIEVMEMINTLKLVFIFLLGMAIGGSIMGTMYKDKVDGYEQAIEKYNVSIR